MNNFVPCYRPMTELLRIQLTETYYLPTSVMVLIVLFLTFLAVVVVNRIMNRFIRLASEHLQSDPTQYRFLKHTLSAAIIIIGIGIAIYIIPALRTLAVSMFAGAGIIAIIIGFASQQAFANIISGMFIVMFKPFRINDIIQVGERHRGMVEDITLRHTVIRNWENRRIIIPNAIISNEIVTNDSIIEEHTGKHWELGISYDSDIDKAIAIIQDEAGKHPNMIDVRTPEEVEEGNPLVRVRVVELGEYFIKLRVYLWAEDPMSVFAMSTDLNKIVKERFDREGIEIPFPYRTLVYKKDLEERAENKPEK